MRHSFVTSFWDATQKFCWEVKLGSFDKLIASTGMRSGLNSATPSMQINRESCYNITMQRREWLGTNAFYAFWKCTLHENLHWAMNAHDNVTFNLRGDSLLWRASRPNCSSGSRYKCLDLLRKQGLTGWDFGLQGKRDRNAAHLVRPVGGWSDSDFVRQSKNR